MHITIRRGKIKNSYVYNYMQRVKNKSKLRRIMNSKYKLRRFIIMNLNYHLNHQQMRQPQPKLISSIP